MKYNKITISGKICTGKTTLLKSLEKHLGWPTFMTGQLFREHAKKKNLQLEGAEEQNQRITREVDERVKKMLHEPGHLIVDGWMSGLSANSLPDVMKILLECDNRTRYGRFANREKVTLTEAKKRVEERQGSWFEKIEKIHKIKRGEFIDPKNYTIVIDTTNLSTSKITKKVLQLLK